MNNYIHARTCIYNINYHIVWCVKYRKKVLTPEIEEQLVSILHQIAEEKGFCVVSAKVGEMDHIHVFVSAPPKLSPTEIVRYLKGISGIKLFKNIPSIKNQLWNGQLWNGSYFLETIGSTSEENIKNYIERQKNCQM